jgi:hypothetical protein
MDKLITLKEEDLKKIIIAVLYDHFRLPFDQAKLDGDILYSIIKINSDNFQLNIKEFMPFIAGDYLVYNNAGDIHFVKRYSPNPVQAVKLPVNQG